MYSIKALAEPSELAVTLVTAKLHLRVDHTTDDTLITTLITVAKKMVEHYTNRVLISTTYNMYLPALYSQIAIPKAPVTALSSIKYYDSTNTQQTLSSSYYDVDLNAEFPIIKTAYNYTYPNTYDRAQAVDVQFIAGWTQATIPQPLAQAILLIIGHLYENRQNVVVGRQVNELPQGAEMLCNAYKIYSWK